MSFFETNMNATELSFFETELCCKATDVATRSVMIVLLRDLNFVWFIAFSLQTAIIIVLIWIIKKLEIRVEECIVKLEIRVEECIV